MHAAAATTSSLPSTWHRITAALLWMTPIFLAAGIPVRAQDRHPVTGEDAARLAEIHHMENADIHPGTDASQDLSLALEALEIRKRHQPADWWEVGDARRRVETLRRAATLPPDVVRIWNTARREYLQARVHRQTDVEHETTMTQLNLLREHFGPDFYLVHQIMTELGGILMTSMRLDEAERVLTASLEGLRESLEPEHPQIGVTLSLLGVTKSLAGRLDEGKADSRRSIRMLESLVAPTDPRLLEARLGLANIFQAEGAFEAAVSLCRTTLEHCGAQGIALLEVRAALLATLARNLHAMRLYSESERVLREHLALCLEHRGETHPETLSVKVKLADALAKHGGADIMKGVYDTVRERYGQDDPQTIDAWATYGMILLKAGDHEEAFRVIRSLLAAPIDRYRADASFALLHAQHMMAFALIGLDRLDEAEEIVLDDIRGMSRAFGRNHPNTNRAKSTLLTLRVAQERYEEAETLARALLRASAGSTDPAIAFLDTYTRAFLGMALLSRGALVEAEAELLRASMSADALLSSDSGLKRSLDTQTFRPWMTLATVYAEMGKPTESFQSFEAHLARGLLDDLTMRIEPRGTRGATSYDLTRIQAAIPDDAVLIGWGDQLWMRGRPGSRWAFALRRDGPPVVAPVRGTGPDGRWTDDDDARLSRVLEYVTTPPSLTPATRRGTQFVRSATGWTDPTMREDCALIWRQRFSPVESALAASGSLPRARHLIVIPTGDMAPIPIEALAPDYTISYIPSGSVLALLSETSSARPTAPPRLLALGTDTGSTPDTRLLRVRDEIESVARCFVGDRRDTEDTDSRATMLLGEAATPEAFLRAIANDDTGVSHLHIACHATIDEDRPLESYLQLTASGTGDGRLRAADLARPEHHLPRSVVLSACETARGKRAGSEGMIGFVRVLLAGGVRTLIVSRWAVDDIATSLLMTRYYADCFGRRLPPARALAEARLWLRSLPSADVRALLAEPELIASHSPTSTEAADIRPFDHPYYWSPFMAIGATSH